MLLLPQAALARATVDASAPQALAVSVYRAPDAEPDSNMNLSWLNGYALVSETRTVTLPPGESTVRFAGVVGGMVAVSAIVTGLPDGTIEKNRNAALLSPGSLVDGTLGNRVTVTRTNPATGTKQSEDAVIRTRADGGLVLQTRAGFEAIGCAGVAETLGFDRVPGGLLPVPVYSVDTRSEQGGTYTVRLTYLASGFDWRAHYVATFDEGSGPERKLHLTAWLTMANENGESLPDAELMAVAGKLNVESDFREMSDAPQAPPLSLTCYPMAIGGPRVPEPPMMVMAPAPAPPPPMMAPMAEMDIVVTANAKRTGAVRGAPAMVAKEEDLGDLKLFRVPQRVEVAAKGLKQVAFLDAGGIRGEVIHKAACSANDAESMDPADEWDRDNTDFTQMRYLWRAKNDKAHGLGRALPMGKVSLFESTAVDELLLGEDEIRDYASGEDVEFELGSAPGAMARCTWKSDPKSYLSDGKWHQLQAELANANAAPISVEVALGDAGEWQVKGTPAKVTFRDGVQVMTVTVPAHETRTVKWRVKNAF